MNVNCLEGEHNNWSERVAVTGVGGRVFVENWRRVIGFLPGDPQAYYWEPEDIRPADDQNSLAIHGFVGELRDFVESVREGRAPACTIEDGLAAAPAGACSQPLGRTWGAGAPGRGAGVDHDDGGD